MAYQGAGADYRPTDEQHAFEAALADLVLDCLNEGIPSWRVDEVVVAAIASWLEDHD